MTLMGSPDKMKILSLELSGFIRMRLTQIKRFKMTCDELIQLILGTNGSGKSSLMEELTPLPAVAGNYTKEGYKIIEISHNGHNYVLSSRFFLKLPHSFVKDGKELNDGGTQAVQKELVRQEFGITPEIHELLIGLEKFTQMSPMRKREWFTKLGEANYDYSLKVFGQLKKRQRDMQGALDLAKKRLVIETSRLITPDQETRYRQEIDELHRVLTVLIENRTTGLGDADDAEDAYLKMEAALQQDVTKVLKTVLIRPANFNEESGQAIEFKLWDLEQQLKTIRAQIDQKSQIFGELEKMVSVLGKMNGQDIQALEARRGPILKKQQQIRQQQKFGFVWEQPLQVLQSLDGVENHVVSLVSEIPPNADGKYSRATLEKAEAELLTLKDKKLQLEAEYRRIDTQRLHMEQHKQNGELECPQCRHRWIKGFNAVDLAGLQKQLQGLDIQLEEVSKLIKTTETTIQEIRDYGQRYKEYQRLTQSLVSLAPFWHWVEQQNKLREAPQDIIHMLSVLRMDLNLEVEFQVLQVEEAEISALSKALMETQTNNLEEAKTRLQTVSDEVTTLTKTMHQLKTQLGEYQLFKETTAKLQEYQQRIEERMEALGTLRDTRVEILRNQHLNECIRNLQYVLATKEKSVSEAVVQQKLVADINFQIKELERSEESYKLLVKHLSPTDGLIAEGLFGFIRVYVKQMNKVIAQAWTYPLEVVPCGMNVEGGVELDYKFPLMTPHSVKPVPDVSRGSSGMREIVDLAYKVIAMKYLGLSHAPMYLDEFATSFDQKHKVNAVNVIKTIMEQQNFSQLFIISHDFNQYGSFANIEVCVLCGDNITAPHDANRHVVIE